MARRSRRYNDQPELHSQYTERNRARSRLTGKPGSTRNPNLPQPDPAQRDSLQRRNGPDTVRSRAYADVDLGQITGRGSGSRPREHDSSFHRAGREYVDVTNAMLP
jgi:hypothetical protein